METANSPTEVNIVVDRHRNYDGKMSHGYDVGQSGDQDGHDHGCLPSLVPVGDDEVRDF